MAFFIQKETISMSGSAVESAITLNRGSGQHIREVRVYFPNAVPGDYVQIFRKSSATTAAEKDDSDDASNQVLLAEGYLNNGDLTLPDYHISDYLRDSQLRTTGLRILVSSSQTGTVYLNIAYEYN